MKCVVAVQPENLQGRIHRAQTDDAVSAGPIEHFQQVRGSLYQEAQHQLSRQLGGLPLQMDLDGGYSGICEACGAWRAQGYSSSCFFFFKEVVFVAWTGAVTAGVSTMTAVRANKQTPYL